MKKIIFVVLFIAISVKASDGTGIYGRITSVSVSNCLGKDIAKVCGKMALSFIPTEGSIYGAEGTFSNFSGEYLSPKNGCLYYSCPKDKAEECSKIWNDLKKASTNGKCVGFGSRRGAHGPGVLLNADEALQVVPMDISPVAILDKERCNLFGEPALPRDSSGTKSPRTTDPSRTH